MRVRRHGLGALLLLLLAIALSCGGIEDEDLRCEEAVSRLEECCPAVDARRFSCDVGCNSTVVFTTRASDCIRAKSCNDLRNRGVCENMTRLSKEPYPSFAIQELETEACR